GWVVDLRDGDQVVENPGAFAFYVSEGRAHVGPREQAPDAVVVGLTRAVLLAREGGAGLCQRGGGARESKAEREQGRVERVVSPHKCYQLEPRRSCLIL